MQRRSVIENIAVGAAFLFVSLVSAQVSGAERPNVLVVIADDLNHWVGYTGRNVQTQTPHIDRLAERGVVFSRAYCAAPLCSPSRAALFSGLRPGTSGAYNNFSKWRNLIAPDRMIMRTFRESGYLVFGGGKIFHAGSNNPEEWDEYFQKFQKMSEEERAPNDTPVMLGDWEDITPLKCTDEEMPDYQLVTAASEILKRKHKKPFLMMVGLQKPHTPLRVPKKYYDLHPLDQILLPPFKENDLEDIPQAAKPRAGRHKTIVETGTWKLGIQAYLACTSFCDVQVGRLIDALDDSEYRDNTIVLFIGDHGWHLGEKHHWTKSKLWEESARAPMIWVVPGVTPAKAKCERTVDFMSVYPTLCELTGVERPAHVEGENIKPLLTEPSHDWNVPAVTTMGFQNHSVRSERWRYIRYANGEEELYDEEKDPYEWHNLARDAQFDEIKKELSRWLPTTNKDQSPRKRKK